MDKIVDDKVQPTPEYIKNMIGYHNLANILSGKRSRSNNGNSKNEDGSTPVKSSHNGSPTKQEKKRGRPPTKMNPSTNSSITNLDKVGKKNNGVKRDKRDLMEDKLTKKMKTKSNGGDHEKNMLRGENDNEIDFSVDDSNPNENDDSHQENDSRLSLSNNSEIDDSLQNEIDATSIEENHELEAHHHHVVEQTEPETVTHVVKPHNPRQKHHNYNRKVREEVIEEIDHQQHHEDNTGTETNGETYLPLTETSTEQKIKVPLNLDKLYRDIDKITKMNKAMNHVSTYINCDLRYFNIDYLVDKVGNFDVVLMDPPWRIKGGQQNDSSFMFSNSKFNLEYDTMSNQEIMNLKVEKLSKSGFIFLWILSNQLDIAYEMLNKWGYDVIDQIIWVKLKDSKIYLSHGYYFMHSFEMCLVGYKCLPGEVCKFNAKMSSNIIYGEVRKKSQKPDELYEIIETLMPGSKKIELFARNNNLRPGWLSLGNQIGEVYDKWLNKVDCNACKKPIQTGTKRYKSKKEANYDLCEKCFELKKADFKISNFFEMRNLVDEDVLHHYHSCNYCHCEPIWGTRFECLNCDNYDLCEQCYDHSLTSEKKLHDTTHDFRAIEVPVLANGLPAHCDKKCSYCFQKPILGVRFSCSGCTNLNFCQNCYFSKPPEDMKKYRGHRAHHQFEIVTEPVETETKSYKCNWCDCNLDEGVIYKCENCFYFFFCEKCHTNKDQYKSNIATSHKFYHSFVPVNAEQA